MIDGSRNLLAALQHGDSFFPSGAVSFSAGLESLIELGAISTAAGVAQFVQSQITHRWATFDLPVMNAVMSVGGDLDAVAGIDERVEAQSLAAAAREGSKRAGASLLSVHVRMGTSGAEDYQRRMRASQALGHLPVVQGLVWAALGFDKDTAATLSGHALAVGLIGAAIRLGLLGHVEAQKILREAAPLMASAIDGPVPLLEDAYVFTPMSEIAVMRHETADSRLFMT